ncbi:reprolysin-like metallopeptidase [Flavivirga spongiicola]|uniref:M12 family metallo-peptidase n=1 Tax=Flavivirga spongiicola TaxID=421621 RepID=A0ABU7XUU9_9FLAO|nr:zinc-dependent metalloprotease family protein [Flavivirga sp. MEBiC05379]MDO5979214.1 M12 family metallo-peptidase [Flavivirga sp. MEBiC05379]
MKQPFSSFTSFFVFLFFFTQNITAQNQQSIWVKTSKEKAYQGKKTSQKAGSDKINYYQLNINNLKKALTKSPKTKSKTTSDVIINFPNSEGGFEAFRIIQASIMEPSFQLKHPEIRTYEGVSVSNPSSKIRLSITPQGLHTMLLSTDKSTEFIDPISYGNSNYKVYKKTDLKGLKKDFICHYIDDLTASENLSEKAASMINANDGLLRTYDLALASTVEYSNYHINLAPVPPVTDSEKKAVVLAAMVVTMNRVNGIFKNDLSLTMNLIDNTSIIFLNEPDGYTNNDGEDMLDENQSIIDAAIGAGNYDIGHVFSTGGGGVAILNSPCVDANKAKGVTGLANPIGDIFDIEFVAHEMGHQFGAPHTWSSSNGSCTSGQWSSTNSYEPGSGSTIMGYAGICSPGNVQANGDDYFHQKSLQMIWANINSGNSSTCVTTTSTGNSTPTADAGNNYTIPISTPYKLTGASTDVDGTGTHTYTWEQYDLATSHGATYSESSLTGPLVRSFKGTSNTSRYIPKLSDLISSGGSTTWEKLASVSRAINFQLTVRDNDTRGGQTATDNMVVTTNTGGGPFLVTSQNTSSISYPVNSTQTITWDIANTTLAPISTSLVNIRLSTDGGLTYPTLLSSNTNNDGTEDVTLPVGVSAPYSRIMVEAVGNIFFAINSTDFSIGYTITTTCNQQFSSNSNLNLSILDNQQVSNIINVPASGTVNSVKVNVDVTHSFISDLTVTLTHPNTTTNTAVWNKNCFIGAGYENFDITFEDNTNTIVCGNNITGTYTPENSLNIFKGLGSSGNWTLTIADGENGDQGTFNDWYVEFCITTEATLSTHEFSFENFKIFPNPNKGKFTINFNASISNKINIDVHDLRGRTIFKNSYKGTGHFNKIISLNNVQSGMYILNVSDGIKKSTRKIIVE